MDNGVCTSNKVTAKLKVVDSSNAYIKEKKNQKKYSRQFSSPI